FFGKSLQCFGSPVAVATVHIQVLALHPSKLAQRLQSSPHPLGTYLAGPQPADATNLRGLRECDARCDKNCCQRPAEAPPRYRIGSPVPCHPFPSADGRLNEL